MARTHALAATPLCELLGCRHPLILAGMGGVARSELVAAVSAFGGFGILGMVREPLALIEREVARVRALTDRPFGVNLIPSGTAHALLRSQVDLCIALRVPVVELFWDIDEDVIDRLRAAGITVVHQVGTVHEALHAQAAGAHAIIAQGVEAGGHVRGRQPLLRLLPEVLGCVDVPVA
ncbi:MAG: nitronate monooxygenase, partial [Comamonas sp.]